MPAFSIKAKNQHPAGAEGQQFPLHHCHVQITRATLGASGLEGITHPMAFKVLNPNIRKQTLGTSRTNGAGLVLLIHKATTRGGEQTSIWTPRASAPATTSTLRHLCPEAHQGLQPIHATGCELP